MAYAETIAWRDATYKNRTAAVEAGNAPIDWIVPEYRVTFTECLAHAESIGTVDPIELREELAK